MPTGKLKSLISPVASSPCVSQDEEKAEEKAEDEMAKRRNAFLLKQQRKAEEARLRKQHQEVESEVKRDEARYVSVSH